jgi:hypothetical protein
MKRASIALSILLANGCIYAGQITVNGTKNEPLKIENNNKHQFHNGSSYSQRTIKLLNVNLSADLKANLKEHANKMTVGSLNNASHYMLKASKPAVQLGMNGVPVLNQGQHGTCATFANTAAVDAVLNKGDYVSQLCQLELGNYLEENGYFPSGWDGSFGPIVLNQMAMFGVVNKDVEKQQGCGGLNAYPMTGADPHSQMTPDSYHNYSEGLANQLFSWSPILDINNVMFNEYQSEVTLSQVKEALSKGDRVTFGVLLFDFEQGTMGAIGTHKTRNDTWVLTPELMNDLQNDPEFGGHEMIITGYDDNAVVKDAKGRQYKGLLTLRNSWGTSPGNKGDFYMSYDYFKMLAIEAQRIRKLTK